MEEEADEDSVFYIFRLAVKVNKNVKVNVYGFNNNYQNMNPTISYILIGIFFLFIFRSIYSLYGIFEAPTCKTDDVCYKSFLNGNPELDLYVYVSDSSKSVNFDGVFRIKTFDYTLPFEKYIFH